MCQRDIHAWKLVPSVLLVRERGSSHRNNSPKITGAIGPWGIGVRPRAAESPVGLSAINVNYRHSVPKTTWANDGQD
jgi:hypothetical protein